MVEHHLTTDESGQLQTPLTEQTRGPDADPKAEFLLLVAVYPEGDCDTCPWPFTADDHKQRLINALFDEGNMGRVVPGKVFLPDGTLFGEIVPCGFNLEEES